MATPIWLTLEMLLEHRAQWHTEQRLERERMTAEREQMTDYQNQWAGKCIESTKETITGSKSNIYKMVDPIRYCGSAKGLDGFLDMLPSNFNSHGHLFPQG